MIGSGVRMTPGAGLRSGLSGALRSLLLDGVFQNEIETSSIWTPVAIGASALNREHADVVRWIGGAEEIVAVSEPMYTHPVFERLHIVLR